MLGDNIATVNWPACGEMDIMESVGKMPSTNYGSIHGTGFTGTAIGTAYTLPEQREVRRRLPYIWNYLVAEEASVLRGQPHECVCDLHAIKSSAGSGMALRLTESSFSS